MAAKFDIKDLVIGNRYKLGHRIGGGSFGEIYRGQPLGGGDPVAVKIELAACKFPQLVFELRLYQSVNPKNDGLGIPSIYWYGREGDYNCLVMDLLGPSLEDLHAYCGRKFSFKTTMILGAQMLNRLEYLHNQGFIHRDIKPDNFLMGTCSRAHVVYIIDFGLAKRYREPKTLNHITHKDGKSLTGTARYCSINTHCGIEQSRRDDLDAIAFMLVYFIKGRLPWQELQAPNKQQRYDRIMEKKMSVTPEQLCAGIPQPEVLSFIRYCRNLGFSDTPDYAGWRRVFIEALKHERVRFDYSYDWNAQSSSTTSFPPNPLITQSKLNRRRLIQINASGARLDVIQIQPSIPLPPRPAASSTDPSDTLLSPTGTSHGFTGATIGSEDAAAGRGIGNSVSSNNNNNNGEGEEDYYVAVVPQGAGPIYMASNLLQCRFMPCEPFLIPRQQSVRSYDSSGSDTDGK